MDELLREFLTDTNQRFVAVDAELVRFERKPNNADIPANVFCPVHTVEGTCGSLRLLRLDSFGSFRMPTGS
jgi:two-component system, chemotaxis family, sensor kinase CheA